MNNTQPSYKIYKIYSFSSAGPFEFSIPGSNEYTLLPLTRLHGTCQIVRKDGSILPDDTEFSTVNLFPHALFSQVDLEIDGVNLSSHDNLYRYKAYLETLLSYGTEAKKSQLTTSHFVKDTAHNFENFSDGNKGYARRRKDVVGSRIFDFCVNPHIDFLHTSKVLPSGIPIKIKLTRSSDSFSILSASDEDLSVKIHSLSLFVYRIQPSESVRQHHNKLFNKKNALFPITKTLCKKYTVPSGLSSANQPNLINGLLPRQIVIGFVKADALNGAYKLNPFNFQHFDCNFIALRVNGLQIPAKGYRPNFEWGKELVRRELRSLYDNIGVNDASDDVGCNLNVWDFIGGYTLFSFDLTPDKCNGSHLHENSTGIVDLEILFSKPLEEAITVLCYTAHESIIAITKERGVLTS